jgi:hypothetical protein
MLSGECLSNNGHVWIKKKKISEINFVDKQHTCVPKSNSGEQWTDSGHLELPQEKNTLIDIKY